jgi:small subunit ribosomal protein S21
MLLCQTIVNLDRPFDVALKQFSRSVQHAGIMAEARRRRHYETPQAKRKRKAAAAAQRRKRKRSRF